jgi:hypothetical protein
MTSGELVTHSPADLDDLVFRSEWSLSRIDNALSDARAAFPAWRKLKQSERAEYLRKYQAALKARVDELTSAISREIGKPLWEAKTEVQAMISKVDVTLTEGAAFTKDHRIEDLPGEIRHRPHGVERCGWRRIRSLRFPHRPVRSPMASRSEREPRYLTGRRSRPHGRRRDGWIFRSDPKDLRSRPRQAWRELRGPLGQDSQAVWPGVMVEVPIINNAPRGAGVVHA